jgi:hypothetical protein
MRAPRKLPFLMITRRKWVLNFTPFDNLAYNPYFLHGLCNTVVTTQCKFGLYQAKGLASPFEMQNLPILPTDSVKFHNMVYPCPLSYHYAWYSHSWRESVCIFILSFDIMRVSMHVLNVDVLFPKLAFLAKCMFSHTSGAVTYVQYELAKWPSEGDGQRRLSRHKFPA